MRDRLEAELLVHDRAWARGDTRGEATLEERLLTILREGVSDAGGSPGSDPWPALKELWGLFGTTGASNGVQGLHLGHIVVDEDRQVL